MTPERLWHNLARKFRDIFDPGSQLHAKWKHPRGSPHDTRWEIAGEASAEARTQLLSLAKFAGHQLDPDSADPLRVWLNKLKDTRPSHEMDTREFTQADGSEISYEYGTLKELRNACANICDQLELVAMVAGVHPEAARPQGINIVRRAKQQLGQLLGQRSSDSSTQERPDVQDQKKKETIGAQIKRLRDECRWTLEELAEAIDNNERTVRRHEADEVAPYARTIRAYERVFSKRLERKIVISKMS